MIKIPALIALILMASSAAHSSESVLADPVKRNHFCHDHFPVFVEWQQCHEMWPYGGEIPNVTKTAWAKCEIEASKSGKLDEKQLAKCLSGHMKH